MGRGGSKTAVTFEQSDEKGGDGRNAFVTWQKEAEATFWSESTAQKN